jgi:phosphoserine phosphatase RsbU/P
MQILIAEDDFTSRSLLDAVLKKSGYDVIAVENGADALEALQKDNHPPIAILDWMMPQMDGVDVVRNLRKKEHSQPVYIIMLTTKHTKSDIINALQTGANDYLIKPFDIGELTARVNVAKRMVELQTSLAAKIKELESANEQIKTLSGIVPICASCKNIRDDTGYWQQVEEYISKHSEAVFSHGICPSCMQKLYPDVYEHMQKKERETKTENNSVISIDKYSPKTKKEQ